MARRNPAWRCGIAALFLTLAVSALAPGRVAAQTSETDGPAADRPEVFMWVGANRLLGTDPALLRDMLLFARRNGITPYSSGMRDADRLDRFLSMCREVGLERTWIEIGPDRAEAGTIDAFVRNSARRASTLETFRELAAVYRRHYPDFARITLFDEAPLGGFARPGHPDRRSYVRDAALFRRHGPAAFAHLRAALKEGHPGAEVGIFLHHPHNASPEMAGDHSWIGAFMDSAAALGQTPDFVFSDVYRGYFNRGYGHEATNAYITDVVATTSAAAHRHGARAYQLGQTHTIKLGYTPGRWEIDGNVDAMLAGGADGIGWYWPNYAATDHTAPDEPAPVDVSFDPFVPNAWGAIGPAGSMFGTSRDRWVYSYLRALEATGHLDPDARFDLWLYGHDFDHGEHRVYLRVAGGEPERGPGEPDAWELLGTLNPQQDRDAYEPGADPGHVYSYHETEHAVVFHALDRRRFLEVDGHGEPRFELRIETDSDADGSWLTAALAMPYRATPNFLTEERVTALLQAQPRWVAINSLARHVRPRPLTLAPGGAVTLASMAPGGRIQGVAQVPDVGDESAAAHGSAAARESGPGQAPAPAPLLPAAFWRSQAMTDVLPFWDRHARDDDGGFRAFLDRGWEPTDRDGRFPGMVSRHLFSYAAGYLLTGEPEHLDSARTALDWMLRHGWDPEHGGWYNEVAADGEVVDASKDLFMQLYAATGLAFYWVVTHDREVRQYLDRTLALLDRYAWDEVRGGYVASLSRDLSVADPGKDISPQLAPLSGYLLYLYLATRDDRYLEQAQRVLDVVLDRMRDPGTAWVLEHWDTAWTAVPGGRRSAFRVSVGHNLETAWMAARLHGLTGREDYRAAAVELGRQTLEHAFLPETGAWLHHFELADPAARAEATPWWVQAYGNMTALSLFRLTGEARYLEAFREGAAFWNRHVIDPLYGGAYLSVDTLGRVVRSEKAVRTKTSYHAMEHGLLLGLYTGLWLTGEPRTLHFRVTEPGGERLWPIPVVEPEARITAVEVNGRPWSGYDGDAGWVRLPSRGPASVRVTVHRPAEVTPRFDLVVYGRDLDPTGMTVRVRENPSAGDAWVPLVEPATRRGDDGWAAVVYPGLSALRFLGQDIREGHVAVRVQGLAGAASGSAGDPAGGENAAGPAITGFYVLPRGGDGGPTDPRERADAVHGWLATDPGRVESASAAAVVYPRPRTVTPGGAWVEHVEAPVRHRRPGELEVEWLEILFRYGR
ncbi:MAG: AGE family epimerase/isomerase [Longimicrobiales bacterium]